jgi:hypothetical protein
MKNIVILTHPNDEFVERGYSLGKLADQWRNDGHRITVVDDPTYHVEADLAILHVDLTVVPDEYLEFMSNYDRTVNAGVKDISKRNISANLVTRGDGYDGPVMIKTNLNCGGTAEGELRQRVSLASKFARAIRRRLHWSMRSELDMWGYPIFDSVKQVPWAVWRNRSLVVEKFLPERSEGFYVMRSWLFLGGAEVNFVFYANQPIIKSKVAVRIDVTTDVPDEIRQMRKSMGFDFGKFDYGIVNGRAVLYDANRTPMASTIAAMANRMGPLVGGIDSFFADGTDAPRLRAAG